MNVESLTIGQAREIASLFCGKSDAHPWKVGTAYLIRTVTNFWVGRLTQVTACSLVLVEASWVADTGRFHQAVASGSLSEVEPVPRDVIVSRGSIVDATEWPFALPKYAK